MRVFDNGVYRDATPEELAKWAAEAAASIPPEPTAEEKLAALIAALEGGVQNA